MSLYFLTAIQFTLILTCCCAVIAFSGCGCNKGLDKITNPFYDKLTEDTLIGVPVRLLKRSIILKNKTKYLQDSDTPNMLEDPFKI